MDVIYPPCAGLDVHKQTVVACARLSGDGASSQEVRTFATTTSGLLALADWLESLGVQHVAMEATGVYWKPVWRVLEGRVGEERRGSTDHAVLLLVLPHDQPPVQVAPSSQPGSS